jgi:glycosyltransferase involved in cell wall biosynthesis
MQPEEFDTPTVSILVPVYNAASTIHRCVDSLLAQTYKNLDIVLVDDGSTDSSGKVLDQYAAQDSRIQVIHQKNGGVARARNTGLAHAKGDWIGFCDSDDEFLPDGIETLLAAAVRAQVPMSMGSYYRCVKDRRPRLISFPEHVLRDEALVHFLFAEGKNHDYLWIRLFRAELFEGISFPDGKLYEDIYILPKLMLAAKSCAFTAKPVYRYHIHRDSISGGLNIEHQLHGLDAAMEAKETTVRVYPGVAACSSANILEICCWLLGKIKAAGKKQYLQSWERVVSTFRREQKTAELSSGYQKLAVLLFRISPDLLGRACQIYSLIKK